MFKFDNQEHLEKKNSNVLNKKPKWLIVFFLLLLVGAVGGVGGYRFFNSSPIDGVSKSTYEQGINILDQFSSTSFADEIKDTNNNPDEKYKEKINSIIPKKGFENDEIFINAVKITYSQRFTSMVWGYLVQSTAFNAIDPTYMLVDTDVLLEQGNNPNYNAFKEGERAIRSKDIDQIKTYVNTHKKELAECEE